ncbi:aldehyde dehydrogenase family protein [Micromonospora cremea]|uniref:Aldehyde dehydrogenase (NAD+) n=1 Tax=Micromonospora cremea TaxID=709881 RepID=A0A1N5VJ32_9ACTN|nr:aldehyde dehydrogenase family protein [Micromonospora cremea]SIM72726.1 aldehyde dehydrogenase (NAD+) [Micromonospora cremea]
MLIDGQWVPAIDGRTYERLSPYDGHLVNTYANGDIEDARRGIVAARRAFDAGDWRWASVESRAAVLRKAAVLLRENKDRLAKLLSEEVGQPRQGGAVNEAANALEYYAWVATDRRDEAVTEQRADALGIIAREPVGVVGVLSAWNAPLSVVHKAAPALAVGCTVVVKPAHMTAGGVLELGRILQRAGLPDGVFNVVTSELANGSVVGHEIAASELVDMVTFTGSTATGRKVMAAAASTGKKVVLELGGKSPNVVFPDVPDLDAAVDAAFDGIMSLGGQACKAGSRLLLHRNIHEDFLARLAPKFDAVRLGDPLDAATTLGPLVSKEQRDRVHSLVQGATEAKVLLGGSYPTDGPLARGWFYEPTLIDRVTPQSTIAQTEVFGPVLSVLPFENDSQAIEIANGTMYGLAGAVWTADIDRALTFAKRLRSGTVWVNTYRESGLRNMPSGGWGASGLGLERSSEGINEFLLTKSIHIRLRPGR